jgi:biotin operon repressor
MDRPPGRPCPPLTEEQTFQVLRGLRSPTYKLLVRVLLDHDQGGELGAYPSHRTIALKTGWSEKTVRNRMSELRKMGVIVSQRRGRYTSYFVVPPKQDDNGVCDGVTVSRHVGTSTDRPESQASGTHRTGNVPDHVPEHVPNVGARYRERKGKKAAEERELAVRPEDRTTAPTSPRAARSPGTRLAAEPYLSPSQLREWEAASV